MVLIRIHYVRNKKFYHITPASFKIKVTHSASETLCGEAVGLVGNNSPAKLTGKRGDG